MKNGKRTDCSDAFQQIIRYAKTDAQTYEFGRLRMLRDKDRQGQTPRNEWRDMTDTGTETKTEAKICKLGGRRNKNIPFNILVLQICLNVDLFWHFKIG